MTNMKAVGPDNAIISYKPKLLVEGTGKELDVDQPTVDRHQFDYHLVDALYHYFEDDGDGKTPEGYDNEDHDTSHGEAIAKLIAERYDIGSARPIDECYLRTPIGYEQIRNSTSFIGGDLTKGHMNVIKRWLNIYLDDRTIYLDGSDYADEHGVGTKLVGFDALMYLASTTKEIIDEGICEEYPEDVKAVMRFINANPTDDVFSSNRVYTTNEQVETKWVVEGRFLADELVKIPEFKKNFNKVVIFGAMRYIVSDQLNLNKLYRLFAKLGRTNTRLFFVG